MKTSTLVAVVGSAASLLLLLAVPKKGEGASSSVAEATFVPKVRIIAAAEPSERSERMTAQLLRLPALDWVRDPFAPIELPSNPDSEPESVVVAPPVVQRVEPEVIPEPELPPARTGPLPALSGISQSGAQRFAIIDRIIVEEGDSLPTGDVVMGIGHRTVTLRQGEEIVVIRLGDGQ